MKKMGCKEYTINDIASKINRSKYTIIKWEKLGFIPRARRNERGWRTYSEKQVLVIARLIIDSDYFTK